MKKLAIIPARGGSKRIPRKNIKEFLGKPIIAYSIEAALQSGIFDEVMVSTDDEEIAAVAQSFGANVPFFRSEKNANDFATLNDVIAEVLGDYRQTQKSFEYGCCILPTAPFVTAQMLEQSFHMMIEQGFDSIRPIVKFSYPIQRAFQLLPDNRVQMFYPEYTRTRSQDLEPAYHDAGLFYWFDTAKMLLGENRGGFSISELEVHDIDSMEDWKIAELKMKLLRGDS